MNSQVCETGTKQASGNSIISHSYKTIIPPSGCRALQTASSFIQLATFAFHNDHQHALERIREWSVVGHIEMGRAENAEHRQFSVDTDTCFGSNCGESVAAKAQTSQSSHLEAIPSAGQSGRS